MSFANEINGSLESNAVVAAGLGGTLGRTAGPMGGGSPGENHYDRLCALKIYC
jgi:hypothetical protein